MQQCKKLVLSVLFVIAGGASGLFADAVAQTITVTGTPTANASATGNTVNTEGGAGVGMASGAMKTEVNQQFAAAKPSVPGMIPNSPALISGPSIFNSDAFMLPLPLASVEAESRANEACDPFVGLGEVKGVVLEPSREARDQGLAVYTIVYPFESVRTTGTPGLAVQSVNMRSLDVEKHLRVCLGQVAAFAADGADGERVQMFQIRQAIKAASVRFLTGHEALEVSLVAKSGGGTMVSQAKGENGGFSLGGSSNLLKYLIGAGFNSADGTSITAIRSHVGALAVVLARDEVYGIPLGRADFSEVSARPVTPQPEVAKAVALEAKGQKIRKATAVDK